ncbi:MAG: hypothetical protein HC880_10560 [Bacteroidia bacterium]|nr:hypothetical protein [Bacteroidia bacterium]
MKKILVFLLAILSLTHTASAQSSVMDFYHAKVKEVNATKVSEEQPDFVLKIIKQDVKNGYLAYTYQPALGHMIGVVESPEEMAYFIANNGKKFVAVAPTAKLMVASKKHRWSGELPRFYELAAGNLIDKTDQYLPADLRTMVESALQAKSKTTKEAATWVKLPQYGTAITVGVISAKVGAESFVPVGELVFNIADGTFKFAKK